MFEWDIEVLILIKFFCYLLINDLRYINLILKCLFLNPLYNNYLQERVISKILTFSNTENELVVHKNLLIHNLHFYFFSYKWLLKSKNMEVIQKSKFTSIFSFFASKCKIKHIYRTSTVKNASLFIISCNTPTCRRCQTACFKSRSLFEKYLSAVLKFLFAKTT